MTQTMPPPGEAAIDSARRLLGETMAVFDPLRFRSWSDMGLTTAQLRVLFLVRDDPGVTAGALAGKLRVTPPTISGIVDRLARLDLVRREEDPADRRLVRTHLTDTGSAACSRLAKEGDVFMQALLAELSGDDLATLVAGLSAFVDAAERVAKTSETEPGGR